MSDPRIAALDHSVQIMNLWFKALVEKHHFADRHQTYIALRAVLQALRDHLTIEQVARLSAQLPILVRGDYFEGWHIGSAEVKARRLDDINAQVAGLLPSKFPRDPEHTTEAVLSLSSEHLGAGQATRSLWPVRIRG